MHFSRSSKRAIGFANQNVIRERKLQLNLTVLSTIYSLQYTLDAFSISHRSNIGVRFFSLPLMKQNSRHHFKSSTRIPDNASRYAVIAIVSDSYAEGTRTIGMCYEEATHGPVARHALQRCDTLKFENSHNICRKKMIVCNSQAEKCRI